MISSSSKPYDKNNIILMYKLSHFNLMQEFCFCSPVGDYLALVDTPLSFLLATKSFYKDLYLFYSVLQMFPNSIYHILKPMVYQILSQSREQGLTINFSEAFVLFDYWGLYFILLFVNIYFQKVPLYLRFRTTLMLGKHFY